MLKNICKFSCCFSYPSPLCTSFFFRQGGSERCGDVCVCVRRDQRTRHASHGEEQPDMQVLAAKFGPS